MPDCYKTIGKHLFIAYPLYAETYNPIIILANTQEEAETIASEHWRDRKLLVRRVWQLENPQVYE